jgi:excinuclease ABC subunit B
MASKNPSAGQHAGEFVANMPKAELALLIQQLQDQMHNAAAELHFELAARLRDEVNELKREFRAMDAAGLPG